MNFESLPIARFRLGRIISTPNAQSRLSSEDILAGIQRHQAGDWGDVDAKDRAANDRALIEGSRLLSVYRSSAGITFWLITEADREATTVLLPQDCQVAGFPLLRRCRISGARVMAESEAAIKGANQIATDAVVPERRVESTDDLRGGVTRRTLKIEAEGDIWKDGIKPKIRLKGNWLERAGFKPGNRVTVICVAVGVLELHSDATPLALNETADNTP